MRPREFCLVFGILCMTMGHSHLAFGGKLSGFEEDATKTRHHREAAESEEQEEKKHGFSRHGDHEPDSTDESCACNWLALGAMVYGGTTSWERVRGSNRSPGEALIPFARLDVGIQDVETDVVAWDIRAEAGYGPFGVHTRQTQYNESEPDDNLTISQVHALYRMSFGSSFEADLGMGVFALDGDETNMAFSLTTPLSFHPTRYFGLEFRPAWSSLNGTTVSDYDLSILGGWRYLSVRIGYRWLRSNNASLDGPQVGLSIRF